ncbi:MAG TPA: tetratricopeptide repeat protein [Candidatus Sulfopaludibacter sp.]|jgi:hypothetical protein|nr:tetratricopeptide repeat protein [Candidatus Sulfopaludibacter sp.]
MAAVRTWVAWIALLPLSAQAGILITHSDKGYQFTDAALIVLNGKDKALSLGAQPRATGPLNKLPNVKLGASLLMDTESGVLALYQDGELTYLIPEGLPKTAPADPAAIWKTAARISYKRAPNDKTPTDQPVASFVAFLSGGTEELAHLCRDLPALGKIGGKSKTVATQMDFMAAVVKAYPSDTSVATLEKYIEQAMRQRYDQFESGTANLDVLMEGLKFAELSQAVYPKTPAQEQLRKALADRKAWLDRRVAILHAFASAKEWDAYLLGNRDFEKYQHAFPEVSKLQTTALSASLQLHKQTAEERLKDQEYGAAYREFHLASLRQPSDKVLQQDVLMAWTDYSRQIAIDRQGKRKQLSAGQRNAIGQALLFAKNYKDAGKLDEAIKSVQEAEAIDPDSLQVLLKKAEVLGAQREFAKALAALDEYDKRAVDDERDAAAKMRAELLYQRTSSLADIKVLVKKTSDEGNFRKAYDLSVQGLRAKDDDPDLLYFAGIAALIVRNPKESRAFFTRYLEAANTLDANPEQRIKVRSLLPGIVDAAPAAAPQSAANWMSGARLPAGVFYDPISLAFQPRVDRVDASNKLKVTFEWEGDKLKAITPFFEKNEHVTGEKKISFAYEDRVPQVISVGLDDTAQKIPAATDADEMVRRSASVLWNNPYLDPVALQRLTGKNITLAIAGNRFFQPFVWDRIHYFRLTYDDYGRVAQAREIADPKAAPGDTYLEFEWDGQQLQAVRGYQGKAKTYERTLQYSDGRLIGEEIQNQGRAAHIKYNYTGGRLATANCEKDLTLDDRTRLVTFR